MQPFKYAIFGFEIGALPAEQQILARISREFLKQPMSKDTLFQWANNLEDAAPLIDQFKAKTCGSAYNVALININQLASDQELSFLLSGRVLGDPRTVFLASLRFFQGPVYSMAREKVEREAETLAATAAYGAPSCIETYAPIDLDERVPSVARLLNAYLEDEDLRAKSRQTMQSLPRISKAAELMRQSTTAFFGRRAASKTGSFPAVGGAPGSRSSGRLPKIIP